MANELLIRLYDVGLGDCIYVRIPGKSEKNEHAFHMLIDCGTWSEEKLLATAMQRLEDVLPPAGGGKKRLDLVVVTHEHKDHIAGFDPAYFKNIDVGAVWMNCAMDPKHPQAGKTRKLRAVAETAMRGLQAMGPSLSPRLAELVSVFQINNAGAMKTLRKTLLGGKDPTYVRAGDTNTTHGIKLHKAKIHVLGPENDFDHFYLGKPAQKALKGVLGTAAFNSAAAAPKDAGAAGEPPQPTNISPAAFRALRSRMQSQALAFAELDGKLKNNSSVVLLIEWNDKRLLFVGDAEWHGDFKDGKMNGAWNVMWKERKNLLGKPVDFLKIGHHGSENATPWDTGKSTGKPKEPPDIMNAILPVPKGGKKAKAVAVVSTERSKYETIPRALLMTEIARRIANTRIYKADLKGFKPKSAAKFKSFESKWLDKAQPLRTDFERIREGKKWKGFIDVIIK